MPTTWEQWLESLLRDGRWLCGETAQAAAVRLGVNLTILREQSKEALPAIHIHSGRSSAPTVILVLRDKHYTVVIPEKARPWPQGLDNFPRAGADEEEADWLPAATPSISTGEHTPPRVGHRSEQSWLPPNTPSARSTRPAHSQPLPGASKPALGLDRFFRVRSPPSSSARVSPSLLTEQERPADQGSWLPPETPAHQCCRAHYRCGRY